MKNFRDLTVWRKSHRLALAVYEASGAFPVAERYGLSNQLGRAAFSIPTNIAEGCGRYGDREFARFLSIAMGSASETEYLLLLANNSVSCAPRRTASCPPTKTEVKRMLATLIGKLKAEG